MNVRMRRLIRRLEAQGWVVAPKPHWATWDGGYVVREGRRMAKELAEFKDFAYSPEGPLEEAGRIQFLLDKCAESRKWDWDRNRALETQLEEAEAGHKADVTELEAEISLLKLVNAKLAERLVAAGHE